MTDLVHHILGAALGLLPEIIDLTRELIIRAAILDLIRFLPL